MTIMELLHLKGKRCLVSTGINNMRVRCLINDVRENWGRVDLDVVPLEGDGYGWVSLDRVEIQDGGR